MTDPHDSTNEPLVLAELLNHVLDKGVVLQGDVIISVADVDLIKLGLAVYLSAIERREAEGAKREPGNSRAALPPSEG